MDVRIYTLFENQRKIICDLERELEAYRMMGKERDELIQDRKCAHESLKFAHESSEKAWMLVFCIKGELNREKEKVDELKKQIARLTGESRI